MIIFIHYISGENLYYKSSPLDDDPWSGDVINLTENGSTGEYSATIGDNQQGTVFIRVGAIPEPTDIRFAQITNESNSNGVSPDHIRSAIGLDSANLDAQLDSIRTNINTLSQLIIETVGSGIDITVQQVAERILSNPTEKILVMNGLVTATNGSMNELPQIPDRVSSNGSPIYKLYEIVYNRESASQGLLEPASIVGIRLSNNGWLYSIASGTTSSEMLHGDRRRFNNASTIELPESALIDKLQAHVLVHNALIRELGANDVFLND